MKIAKGRFHLQQLQLWYLLVNQLHSDKKCSTKSLNSWLQDPVAEYWFCSMCGSWSKSDWFCISYTHGSQTSLIYICKSEYWLVYIKKRTRTSSLKTIIRISKHSWCSRTLLNRSFSLVKFLEINENEVRTVLHHASSCKMKVDEVFFTC